MSQTGKNKKLASFNCDQKMWEQFIARCNSEGTTATTTLTQFIKRYLDDSLDDLDKIVSNDLDKRLDSMIKARIEEYLEEYLVTSNNNSAKEENQAILAICSRLDKVESQLLSESNSKEAEAIPNLTELEQKIEGMAARIKQLTEAILKIQDYLNNQLKQTKKSYSNSYYQRTTQRIQPLTEEGLATRLGVNVETIREQRNKLHLPLFVAWCKGKDRAGMGWEFHENTGLYYPVS
ncbi:hypothetical protein FNW02_31270 [Komarekiella sp. 'clone 1']|uniref:Uncharacterized protein n=2 Tax=Komarekiella TaxID=2022127 RepID=A0AA40T3B0_9NOST|nr:hypothetical protein [Komarekiella delphini-convector]MBD6620153.1 hypothetical protein [Komarekiella delphini-convector SJRDD-AB1]